MATETVNDDETLLEKDEDLKATEARIYELRKKEARTSEEEAEFKDLKKHHRGRVEEQISNERDRAQKETERAVRAEQALEDAKKRLEELQNKRDERTSSNGSETETVTINGKTFYTDEAIALRVQKGLMTQSDGWKMQRSLIKEEAVAEAKAEDPRKDWLKKRDESLKYVKEQGYGWMVDNKDPKYNPNDPLFKEANRLWSMGLEHNPDGPRLALEEAKKNLGMDIKKQDMSEYFGMPKNNSATESNANRGKTIVLSDIENANAIRFWVHGNVTNPKTGKIYTESEALQKALEAKKKRLTK